MNRPKYPKPSKDLSFEEFMCAESKYFQDIKKYCDELEKALDKACQLLDDNDIPFVNKNGIEIRGVNNEQWKEYLMNENS